MKTKNDILFGELKNLNHPSISSIVNFGTFTQIKLNLKFNEASKTINEICKTLSCHVYNSTSVNSGTYYNLIKL